MEQELFKRIYRSYSPVRETDDLYRENKRDHLNLINISPAP
jgi:hypothetical protein